MMRVPLHQYNTTLIRNPERGPLRGRGSKGLMAGKEAGLKWRVAYVFAYPLFRWVFGVREVGKENVPLEGPVIIASNHRSAWDPPVLGFAAYPREVHFIAKRELFNPVLGPIIRFMNAHPIDRSAGARGALLTALNLLKDGRAILIFPEGTRNRTDRPLLPLRRGILWLSYRPEIKERVKVVPAWICGRVGDFKVAFGRPISPKEVEEGEFLEHLSERMLELREKIKGGRADGTGSLKGS